MAPYRKTVIPTPFRRSPMPGRGHPVRPEAGELVRPVRHSDHPLLPGRRWQADPPAQTGRGTALSMAATAAAQLWGATAEPERMPLLRFGSEREARGQMHPHLPQRHAQATAATVETAAAVAAAMEAGRTPRQDIRIVIHPVQEDLGAGEAREAPAASCSTTASPRPSSPAASGARTDRFSLPGAARPLQCEVST